jgi:hypothetical protein
MTSRVGLALVVMLSAPSPILAQLAPGQSVVVDAGAEVRPRSTQPRLRRPPRRLPRGAAATPLRALGNEIEQLRSQVRLAEVNGTQQRAAFSETQARLTAAQEAFVTELASRDRA